MSLFKKSNLPNFLTVFRIAIAVVIIPLLLIPNKTFVYHITLWNSKFINLNVLTLIASILFIIASISDAIDGYLARKFHWISNFGKFWDPLADKILTNTVLFCLASSNQSIVPIWLPIIFLIRDIIVDGIRFNLANKQIVVPANIYGKIKTITLMIGIVFCLFLGNNYNNVGTIYYWAIQNMLIYISAILAILSGIIYAFKAKQQLKNLKDNQEIKH